MTLRVFAFAFVAAGIAASCILQPAAWAAWADPMPDSPAAVSVATLSETLDDESSDQDQAEDLDEEELPQPDTTLVVRPGISLEIENFGGTISVKTWDKDLLKIAADHSLRDKVVIERTGSAVRLKVKSRRWVPATVRYRIVAPRWMKLELSGVNTDIDVEDSRGEVRAETIQGDITLKGGGGYASLSSIQGEVSAQGIHGRVEVSSVNQGVRLENVVGPIFAESVNGGILIQGAKSDSVEASTVNGPVTFEGTVSDAGYYRFATHNGCIDVAMPEQSNATLSLSTFSGGIDSSFPVTLKKIKSKRFQTILGSGRARFEVESFQGTIYLRRPSEARSRCDSGDEEDQEEKEDEPVKVHKADSAKDPGEE